MPSLKHEVQGCIADRAVLALERIAEALEALNQRDGQHHYDANWRERSRGVR